MCILQIFPSTQPEWHTKSTCVLNIDMNAVIILQAPGSHQFSSIRFKSSSVQSLSKTVFCPPSVTVLFLLSSSSSSSLSLSGPMVAYPRNSAGEKADRCSDWEDTRTKQPPEAPARLSWFPICVILLKFSPGLGQGKTSGSWRLFKRGLRMSQGCEWHRGSVAGRLRLEEEGVLQAEVGDEDRAGCSMPEQP